MNNRYFCTHTTDNRKIIYACLDIDDDTGLLVCQACYVRLQNYFMTQWLGMLINDKIQDVVAGLKIK